MNLHRIFENLTPPLLHRALTRTRRRNEETLKFAEMYANYAGNGDLCFDVGANLGNRVRAFRHLGCHVVAIEPQPFCLRKLHGEFGADEAVTIVPMAVGRTAGTATMLTSDVHVLSTLSGEFIEKTTRSGRFADIQWNHKVEVPMTTLDALIAKHGVPQFLKIDVEGFEPEVLAGLSHAVRSVSVEWTPEMPQASEECIRHLAGLGDYEFNYSWGESMKLARPIWMNQEGILAVIREFSGENHMFGDLYARLKPY